MVNILKIAEVREKIKLIESCCHDALSITEQLRTDLPARDLQVLSFKQMPAKKGFASAEGRARMLHDLANIELQAMELGVRTLFEFPEAPREFREQLAEVTISEGRHLKLCLDAIESLGFHWGSWPVHLSLWNAVDCGVDLMDRILIVHRYLEGSGLDAGASLVRRLQGLPHRDASHDAVETIFKEEIEHVDFGSRWFKKISTEARQDPDENFISRMKKLSRQIPYRSEPLAHAERIKAGFSLRELEYLESLRFLPKTQFSS